MHVRWKQQWHEPGHSMLRGMVSLAALVGTRQQPLVVRYSTCKDVPNQESSRPLSVPPFFKLVK